MVYHDDHVLADEHLGAAEYVWEGTQTGCYKTENGTLLEPTGAAIRVRGFLFFEFSEDGLIKNVTSVHNEGVIEDQLLTGNLYP
jgi:hypothetical protein